MSIRSEVVEKKKVGRDGFPMLMVHVDDGDDIVIALSPTEAIRINGEGAGRKYVGYEYKLRKPFTGTIQLSNE